MRIFGFDTQGYSTKKTMLHWRRCATRIGSSYKYLKWKCAAFYSFWKGQVIPPSVLIEEDLDNPKWILGGKAGLFLQSMSRRNPDLFESFITSVLYLKKGLPLPTKKMVEEGVNSTFVKLTTVPLDQPVFQMGNMIIDRSVMESEISTVVEDLFKGHIFNPSDLSEIMAPFLPSTGANYSSSRSLGGSFGYMLEYIKYLGFNAPSDLIEFAAKPRQVSAVDTTALSLYFEQFYTRLLPLAQAEVSAAEPVGLAEPLKVRVITKGPGALYTYLKPLQMFLHKRLRKVPCFHIGGPITLKAMDDTFSTYGGASLKVYDKGEKYNKETNEVYNNFLSLDYSDATNEMYSWCSEAVIESLYQSGIIDTVYRDLSLKAMTRHLIVRRDKEERITESAAQARGQLMGSILSFPILCIINVAICRTVLKLDRPGIKSLGYDSFLVNGDDGVLRGSDKVQTIWEGISRICGLTPSIGKVYLSKDFCNMNSRSFIFNDDRFSMVPYINMGILSGQKRSQVLAAARDDEGKSSLSQLSHEVVFTAPESVREKVLSSFIQSNIKDLRILQIPWFLPEYVGGVGLPNVGRFQPSSIDRYTAQLIYKSNLLRPKKSGNKLWKFQEYAKKHIPKDFEENFRIPQVLGYLNEFRSNNVISFRQLCDKFSIESLFRIKNVNEVLTMKGKAYFSKGFDPQERKPSQHHVSTRRIYSPFTQTWKNARKLLPANMIQDFKSSLFTEESCPEIKVLESNFVVRQDPLSPADSYVRMTKDPGLLAVDIISDWKVSLDGFPFLELP
jgi:hypothetical protein